LVVFALTAGFAFGVVVTTTSGNGAAVASAAPCASTSGSEVAGSWATAGCRLTAVDATAKSRANAQYWCGPTDARVEDLQVLALRPKIPSPSNLPPETFQEKLYRVCIEN
jgi:hypothetical protein